MASIPQDFKQIKIAYPTAQLVELGTRVMRTMLQENYGKPEWRVHVIAIRALEIPRV